MRGRGIGTARGRATIMRGMFIALLFTFLTLISAYLSLANGKTSACVADCYTLLKPFLLCLFSSSGSWCCSNRTGHQTVNTAYILLALQNVRLLRGRRHRRVTCKIWYHTVTTTIVSSNASTLVHFILLPSPAALCIHEMVRSACCSHICGPEAL